ncbi:MAG TPA: VWA domain-containing protein [Pyrinomonadaceae bacterium]|nr:VWA domain-containing protein [Pyrinomonadaceae bacterium]
MRRTPTLIAFACLCLLSLNAHAQQKKPTPTPTPKPEEDDVVRISTELVQTDVMVFDKDGKFVSGLKPEQFELLVDKKPQQISFFESIVTGGGAEEAVLRAAGGKKASQPVVADPGESTVGRTVLFFINDLYLEPGSLARTHKTITNFINNMLGPNDQVAITSASGQIGFLQQLTNNPVVLRAALDRLKMVPGATPDTQRPYISPYAAYVIEERHDRQLFDYFVEQTLRANGMREPDRPIAISMVQQRTRMILRQSDATVKNALSSLVNLMRATAKLPGRKLVFFISDGFLPNFTGSDFTSMMDRATSTANRSSVVIYSVDARGLATDPMLDASSGGGFDLTGIMQSHLGGERTFVQEPLHALAANTGGRALFETNDLTGGIARALDETSRYYLLAWRPENDAQRASNFSKIKVTIVGRPDLKVHLRRGYLGAPPEKSKTEAQPASVEATDVLGVTESSSEELRAVVALGYKKTSGANMQLTSTAQVSAQTSGDSGPIVVNVLGAVFDSNGKAVGSFKQRVEVARVRANALPVYTSVNHQVDVPPGLYQVRVIAAERGTNHLTGVMEWIEIPKVKQGAFSISSLFVGEITEAGGALPVGVNASRRFARSSRLRFTMFIYNAATPPQLGVQIKILRGNQAVLTPAEIVVPTDKLSNLTNIPYTGEFPLSALTPGNYILELTVTDRTRKTSATQQLPLTVY